MRLTQRGRNLLGFLLGMWLAVSGLATLYLVIGTHVGNGKVGWPL